MSGAVAAIAGMGRLPVEVTLKEGRPVRAISEVIAAGGEPGRPVVAARVGGTLYPVDGGDVLEAYRIAGASEVRCVVVEAAGVVEAMRLHVGMSGSRPVNPFMVMDAVRWIREAGGDVGGLDPRWVRLAELQLGDDIRETFERWLGRLADRLETIPEFWHILRPLSEVRLEDQTRALESVMAFVHAMGTVPDVSTLRGILRQFAGKRPGAEDRPAAANDGDGGGGDGGVVVAQSVPENGGAGPLEGTSRISCECGREWYVDARGGDIRRVRETDSMTVLTGECGEPVYAVPREVAEHLGMDSSPVYHYVVPGRVRAALTSGRRLDEETLARVAGVLGEASAGRPEPCG